MQNFQLVLRRIIDLNHLATRQVTFIFNFRLYSSRSVETCYYLSILSLSSALTISSNISRDPLSLEYRGMFKNFSSRIINESNVCVFWNKVLKREINRSISSFDRVIFDRFETINWIIQDHLSFRIDDKRCRERERESG